METLLGVKTPLSMKKALNMKRLVRMKTPLSMKKAPSIKSLARINPPLSMIRLPTTSSRPPSTSRSPSDAASNAGQRLTTQTSPSGSFSWPSPGSCSLSTPR